MYPIMFRDKMQYFNYKMIGGVGILWLFDLRWIRSKKS